MKTKYFAVITFIFSLVVALSVQPQTLYNNVGHIPSSHQETWSVAGLLQDFSSATADTVIMITGSADNDYPEVWTALNNAKNFIGPTSNRIVVIYFPEGTYHFDSPVLLDTTNRNIVFQGAGSDRTTLVFRNMRNSNCITIQGAITEGPIDLSYDFNKGDKKIYPASGTWTIGQWIQFFVFNYDYRTDDDYPELDFRNTAMIINFGRFENPDKIGTFLNFIDFSKKVIFYRRSNNKNR